MPQEYRIGALWIGGALSFLEQLCLKSFVDAGHDVRLHTSRNFAVPCPRPPRC